MKKVFIAFIAIFVFFVTPAIAVNSFADVPADHWAYDAVAQLAADGLIIGYPTSTFKGARVSTRYELALVIAKAIVRSEDVRTVSAKDIELLHKLMIEFKDELVSLGAKTDKLEKHISKLEKGIGSWQLSGRFKFDANFTGGDNGANSQWTGGRGKYNTTRNTARFFLRRQINENSYFDSEIRCGSDWGATDNGDGMGDSPATMFTKFYVGTQLPFWGIGLKTGRFQWDWEDSYGLYCDEDAFFGNWRTDGFWFTKEWANVSADFVVGRNNSGGSRGYYSNPVKNHHFLYTLNLKWTPTDKLTTGLIGFWMLGDGADSNKPLSEENISYGNVQTYGITLGYKITPDIALKGVYYHQKYSLAEMFKELEMNIDSTQYALKLILDVKQQALKFTDLWVEYTSFSNGFGGNNGAGNGVNCYSLGNMAAEPGVFWVRPINNERTQTLFVKAEQAWNKKWSTFLRYTYGNWGTDRIDNAYDWGVGIKYKLNPAITFMLAYDSINYGDKNADTVEGFVSAGGRNLKGKDNVILFQTDVRF